MTVYALINKEVIPYICEKKGVTAEFLKEKTGFSSEKLNVWMNTADPTQPTINQAKKLAACLHIPFAGLYMDIGDIPIQEIPSYKNFRTLDGSIAIDDSSLNIAICDVLLERDFLIEQCRELEIPSVQMNIPAIHSKGISEWASIIRSFFNLNLETQFKCNSPRQLYLYLREKLEEHGIFVQCFSDVPIEIARGFSIYDTQLPIIGINDNDRPPAKSFSMIHELVHLINRESSVCNAMYNASSAQKEEVFCNAVSGEVLVPSRILSILIAEKHYTKPFTLDIITQIAKRFSVSREVIIRRLLNTDQIDADEYDFYSNELQKEIEETREEQRIARKDGRLSGIPRNISHEAIDRTSPAVSKLLYHGFTEDIYSKRDIARHLGIAQKHVDSWIKDVSKWSS